MLVHHGRRQNRGHQRQRIGQISHSICIRVRRIMQNGIVWMAPHVLRWKSLTPFCTIVCKYIFFLNTCNKNIDQLKYWSMINDPHIEFYSMWIFRSSRNSYRHESQHSSQNLWKKKKKKQLDICGNAYEKAYYRSPILRPDAYCGNNASMEQLQRGGISKSVKSPSDSYAPSCTPFIRVNLQPRDLNTYVEIPVIFLCLTATFFSFLLLIVFSRFPLILKLYQYFPMHSFYSSINIINTNIRDAGDLHFNLNYIQNSIIQLN